MLTNTSEIIIRNQILIENKKVLLINHEKDLLANELLAITKEITSLAIDFNHFIHLQRQQKTGVNSHFGCQLPKQQKFDSVIVYFPKTKSLAPYLFSLAASYLDIDGELIVVGENKGGIKSVNKLMPAIFSSPIKRDNARHSLLYTSELISQVSPIKLEDWCSSYQLSTPQGEITICNLVGVFSEKKLDQGTELLLEHLPQLTGNVLDFGCGAGVIAASLLKQYSNLQLDCVDINALALASCELTLKSNGMQANVYPSDGLNQIEKKFDAIISNPPFHDGFDSTLGITLDFVANSYDHLKTSGCWQIVANRHLSYSDVIEQTFGSVNVIAENNKYKIYKQIKA